MNTPDIDVRKQHNDPDAPAHFVSIFSHIEPHPVTPTSYSVAGIPQVTSSNQIQVTRSSERQSAWRRIWAILSYTPIHSSHSSAQSKIIRILWRLLEIATIRITLAPVMLALFMILLVYMTTHPRHVQAEVNPASLGMIYRSVNIPVVNDLSLDGWFIPALDPETIAELGSQGTQIRRPGVVLVHGVGLSHDSYLGLASQLHRRGFAVLLVSTRGQGKSGDAPVTFGLSESEDVAAAVACLRTQPGVRHDAIAVVGYGTGGIATLRANAIIAEPLTAVVADDIWANMDQFITSNMHTGNLVPAQWLAPFYRMTFEAMTGQMTNAWRLSENLNEAPNQPLILARQNRDRASVRELSDAIGRQAQLQVIPPGSAESQNADATRRTLAYLSERLGKY